MIFYQHRAVRCAIIYSLCFILSVTPTAFEEKDGAASQGEAPATQQEKTLADTLLEYTGSKIRFIYLLYGAELGMF